MKATAVAPANIAFIKYWGKKDDKLRLPANSSISMNLCAASTTTTVEFSPDLSSDTILFSDGAKMDEKEANRATAHLDRLRKLSGVSMRAKVVTKNSFPKSAGIASSASGFAALTLAASEALALKLSERELTILARIGSGSACRSIPDGFVLWEKGDSSEASFARSIYPHTHWDLRDILCVISRDAKKVSSTEGMEAAATSRFFISRLAAVPRRIQETIAALQQKDINRLGKVIEEDCLDMHRVMQTQEPPLYYWNGLTEKTMQAVRDWRSDGLAVYFTIDAGPNVHLVCEAKDEQAVLDKAKELEEIKEIIVNKPAPGAHLANNHLF